MQILQEFSEELLEEYLEALLQDFIDELLKKKTKINLQIIPKF